MSKIRWWQIGVLCPWLMAVLLVCDVTGRLVASDLLAFRTWERTLRTGLQPGIFKSKVDIRIQGAYGDLANMANMRNLREYHEEELRTDDLGFRNSYNVFDSQYAGMVLGDSFVVASGVSETETLPWRLGEMADAHFYNAGGRPLMPGEVLSLASTLRMRPGIVIYEVLERAAIPPPQSFMDEASIRPSWVLEPLPRWVKWLQTVAPALKATPVVPWLVSTRLKLSLSNSPMMIIGQGLVKRVKNGKLQPNVYSDRVVHATLRNGKEMLFLPQDLESVSQIDQVSEAWAKYFDWYNYRLKQKGWKLVVCLVPNKYTVYGPLTETPGEVSPIVALGDRIAERLDTTGVAVVNLTHEMQTQAAAGLDAGKYLYWRDDTHWNAAGIKVAAEGLREYLGFRDLSRFDPQPISRKPDTTR